jgi:DNA-binding MarR family transcriptional regulator
MPKAKTVPYATTLLVRDTCLCLAVQRAARVLARRFDEELRPVGLTSGQFSLLMSLNRPAPPAMKDVAALLAMDRTTLTAALKPLAKKRLVQIAIDHDDKRSHRLLLTPSGEALLAAAVPVWKRAHAALDKKLARSGKALRLDLIALTSGPSEDKARPRANSGRKTDAPSTG